MLVWVSGDEAGIYALGTTVSDPKLRPDTPTGLGYWSDPLDGLEAEMRVWVRYERRLLDRPLLKAYLRCDPELWEMRIMRQPIGTNFAVTDHEWGALERWLAL